MFVESIPNRNSRPTILLRETYRENGKIRHRTLANLTKWPPEVVEGLKLLLKNRRAAGGGAHGTFRITRSLPHGHVEAVMQTVRALGLERVLHSRRSSERDLVTAMIVARVIAPGSKLATARALRDATASSTLGEVCGIDGEVHENELYAAMDWLLKRRPKIEKSLAARHLEEGSLVLYDLSSSYLEGETCPLGKYGYSRDGKKGKLQITYGLLCDSRGCPVGVEVFEGNTADPATLGDQISKLRERFGLKRVVLVGDRGMITQARIDRELRDAEGLDWLSALNSGQIAALTANEEIQPELFDERDLAEIQSESFPGERLVVCRNPHLAARRKAKREDLLQATEAELEKIRAAVARSARPLRGQDKIGLRAGKIINKHKMAKHFELEITDTSFSWRRREDKIADEAALDGIYVVRTSVERERLGTGETVERYKDLSYVENAFRSLKTVDLKVRPVYHTDPGRVRAHVFLCMLAYYVEWHMRRALGPLLFDEDDPAAEESRADPVAAKEPSESAKKKAASKQTPEGVPVHSFQTLLKDLATRTRNTMVPRVPNAPGWTRDTEPTPLQNQVFEKLAAIEAT